MDTGLTVNEVRKDRRVAVRRGLPIALLIAAVAVTPVRAHEVPADVTVQAYVKPVGPTLILLVRVPLTSMRDVEFPLRGRGYLALEQVVADRRNVIVLTDGVPSPGDFDRLARSMAEANITVSTVTVSPGADQTIMEDIADLAAFYASQK